MARLYEEQISLKKPIPRTPELPEEHGHSLQLKNDAYLNDYRNRCPFRFVSESGEEYYYWQYGAVFELELTIEDTDLHSSPPYLVDVLENSNTFLDKKTQIADLDLGTMAQEEASIYYRAEQIEALIQKLVAAANIAKRYSQATLARLDILEKALYGGDALDSRVINDLNAQIVELRKTIKELPDYSSQIEELRSQLSDLKTEVLLFKDSFKSSLLEVAENHREDLDTIDKSHAAKIAYLKEELEGLMSSKLFEQQDSIANISHSIDEMKLLGVGAIQSSSLPTDDVTPLLVLLPDGLYVRIDGNYIKITKNTSSDNTLDPIPEDDEDIVTE